MTLLQSSGRKEGARISTFPRSPASALDELTGNYYSEELETTYRLAREDQGLVGYDPRANRLPLDERARDRFALPGDRSIVFHRDAALYEEVRSEVADMNEYLDTDSVRRQAQTILRLTVVTILGLIGTVATGFLGMNLLAEADEPLVWRALLFVLILALTGAATLYTIVKSKVLADFLDALSDERVSWRDKWRVLKRVRRP